MVWLASNSKKAKGLTMNKITVLICLTLLTGCGGGGSGSKTSNPPPVSSSSASSSSSIQSSSEESSSSVSSASVSSSESSVSSNHAIEPLAEGSGTISTRFVHGETYKIDEETGVITLLANPLPDYYIAADIGGDGRVIAASTTSTNVDEIDLIAGTARTLFYAPEALLALAVAPDGIIVGVSQEAEFSKRFIYRFTAMGEVLSKVVSENVNPAGIDFDNDGNLLAVDLFGTWRLDAETGQAVILHHLTPSGQSDIDIDGDGQLRIISHGTLSIYNYKSGHLIKEVILQHDYFAFSPLIHR